MKSLKLQYQVYCEYQDYPAMDHRFGVSRMYRFRIFAELKYRKTCKMNCYYVALRKVDPNQKNGYAVLKDRFFKEHHFKWDDGKRDRYCD